MTWLKPNKINYLILRPFLSKFDKGKVGFFVFFSQTSVYAFTIFSFFALNLLHLLPVFDEL